MRDDFPTQEDLVAYLRGRLDDEEGAALEARLAGDDGLRAEFERTRAVLEIIDSASEETTIRRVNGWLDRAAAAGASDLHLDLTRDGGVVRLRIDGVLHELERLPIESARATLGRLKQLFDMAPADFVQVAHGRHEVERDGRQLDLRGSYLPGLYGGRFCARLLNRSEVLIEWQRLGLLPAQDAALRRLLQAPNGMILVAGPTGSGKTTVLYHLASAVARTEVNVLSIEEVIELDLPWVAQTAINERAGLTFPVLLRAAMRQDPDVIMAGELRDRDSVAVCVQLALTGHLVLSSLHTHDALATIRRLIDLGVEPFLVAESLIGVANVRLVRKVCDACAEEGPPRSAAAASNLGLDPRGLICRHGRGCEVCRQTGYRGRVGLFEVIEVLPGLADAVASGAAEEILRDLAFSGELRDFRANAAALVEQGVTTPEEASRVLSLSV